MALHIKDPEAVRLACALARATGLSLTDAIITALREQLERETGRSAVTVKGEDLRAISDRCSRLPDRDLRTPEEILGFDEHGLPG